MRQPSIPFKRPRRGKDKRGTDLVKVAAGGAKPRKLGRGGTRIFLEGLWLLRSGFEAFGEATVLLDPDRRQVVLLLAPELADDLSSGASTQVLTKKISGKTKRGKEVPVIDIERQDLSRILGGAEEYIVVSRHGVLQIMPSEAEALREERLKAPPNNYEVSLYSGAGFLSMAAEQAGLQPAVAIEKWDKAADAFHAVHGFGPLELGVEQVAIREQSFPGTFGLPRNPYLLTAGVPCEPYSKKGGRGVRADDPHDLADQAFWTLVMVRLLNPINVVIENVENFLNYCGPLVRALQVLGYNVQTAMVDPAEHGYAAGRNRAVLVATTHPGFAFPPKRARKLRGQRLWDVLIPPDDPALFELGIREGGWIDVKEGERKHKQWKKDGSPGKGGRRPKKYTGLDTSLYEWLKGITASGQERRRAPVTTFEYDDARVPAITKGMHSGDPEGPYLRHPTKRNLYRLLSADEVAAVHGVPARSREAILDVHGGKFAITTQLYGQGVHVPIFREIIERLPGQTITVRNPFPVVPIPYGPWWGWTA